MSSLALQLFVNLNKILARHPDACPGAHYAKHLVDLVKVEQAQLLACSDPSNAHTAAASAYALGLGLRQMRQQGDPRVDAMALALRDALNLADESLEDLAADDPHIDAMLVAHEVHKHYLVARQAQDVRARGSWGRARGAGDVLPDATVEKGHDEGMSTWKPEASIALPTHVVDEPAVSLVVPIEEDIPQSPTLEEGGRTTSTQAYIPDPQEMTEPTPVLEILSEPPPQPIDEGQDDTTQERDTPPGPIRRQDIPAWPDQEGAYPPGSLLSRYRQDDPVTEQVSTIFDQSEASETHPHTESAAPRPERRGQRKERAQTLLAWSLAPLVLVIPPIAFFRAGSLWQQGRRSHSACLLALGAASTALFLWMGLRATGGAG